MIDFHAHILPHMDDGSRSVEESLALLKSQREQGIDTVVATPHFYANENDPQHFLERRGKSMGHLLDAMTADLPRVILGSEVCYFDGICRTEETLSLRVEGTNLLLLEMPFHKWTGRMISDILELNEDRRIQVLLAHIDRYFPLLPKGVLEMLQSHGVLMQLNAEAFLHWQTRGKVLRLLKEGDAHVLGSDAHDTNHRPVQLASACAVIEKKLGTSMLPRIDEIGRELLEGSVVI